MGFVAGPLSALVRSLTWLPEGLRPAVFAFVLLALGWVLVAHGREIWGLMCRVAAILIETAIGLLLLPEYLVTTVRRQFGAVPGPVTIVLGDVLERALDGSATLYRRYAPSVDAPAGGAEHDHRERVRAPAFPWRLAGAVMVVPIAAWLVMEQAPQSGAADWAGRGWGYWNDVQAWADVEVQPLPTDLPVVHPDS